MILCQLFDVGETGNPLAFWRQYLPSANLRDEVLTSDVDQVSALLIGCQGHTDALRHRKDKRPVGHIEPEAAANETTLSITRERIVCTLPEVRLVES